MSQSEPQETHDLHWYDCTDSYEVSCSIARGGGIWPSLVNVDAEGLSGSIPSGDARELAAMLIRAADACDASTREVFPAAVPVSPGGGTPA